MSGIKEVAKKIGLTEGPHPTEEYLETGINKTIGQPVGKVAEKIGLTEGPHPTDEYLETGIGKLVGKDYSDPK